MTTRKPYQGQVVRAYFGAGFIHDPRARCQRCRAVYHGQPSRCPSCKAKLSKPLSKSQ